MNVSMRGQILLLFAASLVVIIAMAGLLIDGGFLLSTNRQAQAAADTGALAAAFAANNGTDPTTAAQTIAGNNGISNTYTDCDGTPRTNGVVVNRPPSSASLPEHRNNDYVEVITIQPMDTHFAKALGMPCFLVSARAVAQISSSSVANCSFCALSDWIGYSTLKLDNGNDLRVDGDIVVNQNNWYGGSEAVGRCGSNPCTPPTCDDWNGLPSDRRIRMCGDSLYVAHSGGVTNTLLSARTISINGGWQTQAWQDVVTADELAPGCIYHPEPTAYSQLANVCIGMDQIADPLNDPDNQGNQIDPPNPNELSVPVAGQNGCEALPGTTLKVPTGTLTDPDPTTISGGAATSYWTICPGLYYGGFATNGDSRSPKVTMLPGIYFMVGGGFRVTGTASIDGSAGVMIYNSGGRESFSQSTLLGVDLVPACDSGASACIQPIITGGGNGLSGSPSPAGIDQTVTYRMSLLKATGQPKPTGTIAFYDGQQPIACITTTLGGDANHLVATCTQEYPLFGEHWVTAVYSGDAIYAPTGDTFKEVINPPSGEAVEVVMIDTTTSPCATQPCGQVVLHAPSSGPYSGLLIFQERSSGPSLRIWPAAGAPACTGNWMTDGTPGHPGEVPDPCGALGGLSGTIYAVHQSTGSDDWDVIVNVHASGVANLQIIAAQIHLGVVNTEARFAYTPEVFANGSMRLVE